MRPHGTCRLNIIDAPGSHTVKQEYEQMYDIVDRKYLNSS